MTRIFVVLLLMSLGGCLPDRNASLAACRMEANRFFRTDIAVDPDDIKSQYIIGCMATKGYDFTVLPTNCDSRYPFPTQPACYTPTNWLDWIVDKFRLAKKSN